MPPGLLVVDDVHLDGGHFVDAQDPVGVEIGLLDAPVLQRDFAVECGG